MAAVEVHDITLSAVKDLADEILLGRFFPAVGDYVLVFSSCWFGTVVTPTYQGIFTTYEYAKESLDLYERINQYTNPKMFTAFELWHVVD